VTEATTAAPGVLDGSVRLPHLSMQHITKRFPGVVALEDVSFEVQVGLVHGLVGENGAGKSTLMKIMSGIYTEYDGQMLLEGEPVHFRNTREASTAAWP
jgi:ABC-type sugar transport system ATPase subunit